MLFSYFNKIYDNLKPSVEQGLYNLGEKIEDKAHNVGQTTTESLKSADGYIRKYQQ